MFIKRFTRSELYWLAQFFDENNILVDSIEDFLSGKRVFSDDFHRSYYMTSITLEELFKDNDFNMFDDYGTLDEELINRVKAFLGGDKVFVIITTDEMSSKKERERLNVLEEDYIMGNFIHIFEEYCSEKNRLYVPFTWREIIEAVYKSRENQLDYRKD